MSFASFLADLIDHTRFVLLRARGERGANNLLAELGCELDGVAAINVSAVTDALQGLLREIVELQAASGEAQTLVNFLESGQKTVEVIDAITNLGQQLRSLGQITSEGASVEATEIAQRFLDRVIADYLQGNARSIYSVLRMLNVIKVRAIPFSDGLAEGRMVAIDWPQLTVSLSNPKMLLRTAYGWAEGAFRYSEFAQRVQDVMGELGIPAAQYPLNTLDVGELTSRWGPSYSAVRDELDLTILEQSGSNGYVRASISLYPIQKTTGTIDGFALIPKAIGELAETFSLGSNTRLALEVDVAASTAIEISPDKIDIVAPTNANAVAAHGGMRASLEPVDPKMSGLSVEIPALAVFEIASFSNVVAAEVDSRYGNDFFWETTLRGCTFKLGSKNGDGFLNKVLPTEIRATFDLQVRLSGRDGISFKGSGVLEIPIPVHAPLGPIYLDTIFVALSLGEGDGIGLLISASLAGTLGPVAVAVERVGVTTKVNFPGSGGNLGPIDLSPPAFSPPSGVGLAIEAGGLAGGGFLSHDKLLGQYAGILDLKFGDIGLVAVGLITTKLPGGRTGYALFVNIGVTFSPAITLPYNFNLQGCGGLLALNRTMDVEALRSGLRNKTLDSILFPEDPILNANKIISDSERVFPIDEGRFVVGPMAKLGWGANGLIIGNIAIVLELPAPIIIALLGQLKARVPKSEEAKIVLNLDVLGVIDVAKKSLSMDATLYDSKILVYALYGDSALRLSWGSKPLFALSLGGFHPKFSAPPEFPKLRFLTVQLRSSGAFELSAKVYQALTSNSFQFGARLSIEAKACGVKVEGKLTFDSLIIFSPFEFEVDISGRVSARFHGRNIASVKLDLELSGPTPWHAKGKAKVSVLCWDATARFSKTWGSDKKARLPDVDPLPQFLQELDVVGNWNAALLRRCSVVESLKALEVSVRERGPEGEEPQADANAAANELPDLLAHPAGGIDFRQRLLPLGMHLEKFANAEVKNHFNFNLELELASDPSDTSQPAIGIADQPDVSISNVEEHFARGQFKQLSKADRLSKPSYERFKAGVKAIPQWARIDGAVQECELEYETILIMPDGSRDIAIARLLPWRKFKKTLGIAPLKRGALRREGMNKFLTGGDPKIHVKEETYRIVNRTTLATEAGPWSSTAMTQTAAEDFLTKAVTSGAGAPGTLMVLPEYEEEAM